MHKVLIIDDEETVINNTGDYLKAKGYTVFTSLDGETGLEILKKESPHALILDLHLKDGPIGIQILRVAKELKPDIKVIMFTGFGEEEDSKRSCMELGASAFLSKPTSLKNISETVENLLKG